MRLAQARVQRHIARGRDVGPYHNCFAQIANIRFDGVSVPPQMLRVLDLAPASPFAWAGFAHFVERESKRTCGAMMAGGSSSSWAARYPASLLAAHVRGRIQTPALARWSRCGGGQPPQSGHVDRSIQEPTYERLRADRFYPAWSSF